MENGKSRLNQVQENVEEVKGLMLDNLIKAEERSGKLEDLEDRSNQLRDQSKAFSKTSTKVKQKKQWQNLKYKVIIAALGAAVLLGIIVALAVSFSRDDSDNKSAPTTQAPGNG